MRKLLRRLLSWDFVAVVYLSASMVYFPTDPLRALALATMMVGAAVLGHKESR